MDTLNSCGDLPQDPHLVSTITELGTLEVSHLETSVTHQAVVNK